MSVIRDLIQKRVHAKESRLFFLTLSYYGVLFFCNSNIALLSFSFIYFLILWKLIKNAPLAAFLCFFAHLLFVKGKSFSFVVLPKEMVEMYVRRTLVYYFPLTVSDFYLLLFFWLRMKEKGKTYKQRISPMFACLAFFFFFNVVSVLWSDYPVVSLLSVIMLSKLIIIFSLPWYIHFTSDSIKKIISIAAAFTVFEGSWGVLQFIIRGYLGRYLESFNNAYTYGKVAWENSNLLRVSGTFVDPDLFGTFMLMHFSLFFYLFLTSGQRPKFDKALYGLCTLLAGVSVFVTGNRALYACFILSFTGILFITNKVRSLISTIQRPVGFFAVIIAVFALFPYVSTRMQNISAIFFESTGTFRVQIAQYAARLGAANIFGVGLGNSPYHFALDFPGENVIFGPDYPHNIFFQVFAESGILGLVAFIVFIYLAFRPLFLRGRRTPFIYFYLAAGAYLVSACFYPLYVPLVELPSFFFLYLGIAVFTNT